MPQMHSYKGAAYIHARIRPDMLDSNGTFKAVICRRRKRPSGAGLGHDVNRFQPVLFGRSAFDNQCAIKMLAALGGRNIPLSLSRAAIPE